MILSQSAFSSFLPLFSEEDRGGGISTIPINKFYSAAAVNPEAADSLTVPPVVAEPVATAVVAFAEALRVSADVP